MLCDFGLAKVIEDVPSGLTTTSTPSCSVRYAAPELIVGDGSPHTLQSDVWAWGCVLLVVGPSTVFVGSTDQSCVPVDHRCTTIR